MKLSGPWKKPIRKKIDILGENRTLNLETIRESMKKEDGNNRFAYKKDGQTEFVYGSMFLFVEQYGVEAPFYVFFHRVSR